MLLSVYFGPIAIKRIENSEKNKTMYMYLKR